MEKDFLQTVTWFELGAMVCRVRTIFFTRGSTNAVPRHVRAPRSLSSMVTTLNTALLRHISRIPRRFFTIVFHTTEGLWWLAASYASSGVVLWQSIVININLPDVLLSYARNVLFGVPPPPQIDVVHHVLKQQWKCPESTIYRPDPHATHSYVLRCIFWVIVCRSLESNIYWCDVKFESSYFFFVCDKATNRYFIEGELKA